MTSLFRKLRRRLGLDSPLPRADRQRWADARDLRDLGELTALSLAGGIASHPCHIGLVNGDETVVPGITSTLIACNRAGFVITSSQAGFDGTGADGAQWRQLAAVSGFVDDTMLSDGLWALRERGYSVLFEEVADSSVCHPEQASPGDVVSWRDGEPFAVFGVQLWRRDIARLWRGCSKEAIGQLGSAWQVTIYDRTPGRNDLWAVLRSWADSQRTKSEWGKAA